MPKTILNWVDARTGLLTGTQKLLDMPVSGGARWRYTLGFALLATLVVDLVTGLLLTFTYSPSASTAWGSVYFISYQMDLGWFLRGVHRFGSYAAVILGGVYLLRLALGGLYRAPREFQWWLGVVGMLLILVLGVTGNILPWDQRGYWAAVVETTIAGGTPVVGPAIQKVIVGGTELGNQTITRIYGLHVLVLPGMLLAVAWLFIRFSIRNGFPILSTESVEPAESFWPRQAFFGMVAGVVALGCIAGFAIANHGYPLDAPADPSSDYPARPEWYFLPLYQLLKELQGRELIATIVAPGVVVTGLMLLPLLGYVLPRRFAHALACLFVVTLGGGAGYLTYKSMSKDAHSVTFRADRVRANTISNRAIVLAEHQGIPPEGASYLLKLDPLHRGDELFSKKCLGCHNLGQAKVEPQWAPDLRDYGSLNWVRGLLENPSSPDYFGKAEACSGMKEWKETSKLQAKELDEVASYVATFARIGPDVTPSEWLDDPSVANHPGAAHFKAECASCHSLRGLADKPSKTPLGPDLFGWGSDRWTARLIASPSSGNFYGYLEEEQKMPAFGGQLTRTDIQTLVRYLKGDYYRPGDSKAEAAKP